MRGHPLGRPGQVAVHNGTRYSFGAPRAGSSRTTLTAVRRPPTVDGCPSFLADGGAADPATGGRRTGLLADGGTRLLADSGPGYWRTAGWSSADHGSSSPAWPRPSSSAAADATPLTGEDSAGESTTILNRSARSAATVSATGRPAGWSSKRSVSMAAGWPAPSRSPRATEDGGGCNSTCNAAGAPRAGLCVRWSSPSGNAQSCRSAVVRSRSSVRSPISAAASAVRYVVEIAA